LYLRGRSYVCLTSASQLLRPSPIKTRHLVTEDSRHTTLNRTTHHKRSLHIPYVFQCTARKQNVDLECNGSTARHTQHVQSCRNAVKREAMPKYLHGAHDRFVSVEQLGILPALCKQDEGFTQKVLPTKPFAPGAPVAACVISKDTPTLQVCTMHMTTRVRSSSFVHCKTAMLCKCHAALFAQSSTRNTIPPRRKWKHSHL
jgi:hypothetical protein